MTSERIMELEKRLEEFPNHEPSKEVQRFGTKLGVVNDGSEQFQRDAEYGFMMMTITRYIKTLTQDADMNMGQAIDQYLDRFGQKKHLVQAFQTAYEANALGMVQSGALTEKQAIQYYERIKTILTENKQNT